MYVLVKLLKGYPQPLIYKLPDELREHNLVGRIINVPLKKSIIPAVVLKMTPESDYTFKVRTALNLEPFPHDTHYHAFLEAVARLYHIGSDHFYKRIKNFIATPTKQHAEQKASQTTCKEYVQSTQHLTDEQKNVVLSVSRYLEQPDYKTTLLHGVTGSGKTECYKQLMLNALARGKTTLFLLPEVTLSIQFEHLLKKELEPHTPLFGFHSITKTSEKRMLWKTLLDHKPCIIVGVHMPIFLPISNLGLIIIDEEHEQGFQEKKPPKINSKYVATMRAQTYKIPLLLGSATPSMTSLYNTHHKGWDYLRLTKRFQGSFPDIKKIVLTEEKKKNRPYFWITQELHEEITRCLRKKEQVIIYINRRGYSFFVQCRDCGFIFSCTSCSVSLTLHKQPSHEKDSHEYENLMCHYCSHSQMLPSHCPSCQKDTKSFLKKGIGTQQMTATLQKLFANATIARADLDTTRKRAVWEKTLEQFAQGDIDILVGTQMITKGYHFPNVTLVGIIWADLNLHFPVFNAAETTLQKLIQVAGRTGRGKKPSKVIVQTLHNHPIFSYIHENRYHEFCAHELPFRREAGYPPYKRLISLELKDKDPEVIQAAADNLAQKLLHQIREKNLDIELLGPSLPLIHRIQKTESRIIYLKASHFNDIHTLLAPLDMTKVGTSIHIVIDG